MKKYVYRKYSSNYPSLFNKEKQRLRKLLPANAKIEHVGSTAIPGLGGKGILDVAIGTKNIQDCKSKLIKAGYKFKEIGGTKDRLFFKKDYGFPFFKRRVHLQLTKMNSKIWEQHIIFRNLLRKNPKLAKRYADIKEEGVKRAKGDGKIYRSHKEAFIEKYSK